MPLHEWAWLRVTSVNGASKLAFPAAQVPSRTKSRCTTGRSEKAVTERLREPSGIVQRWSNRQVPHKAANIIEVFSWSRPPFTDPLEYYSVGIHRSSQDDCRVEVRDQHSALRSGWERFVGVIIWLVVTSIKLRKHVSLNG
jgi:hypothetical protein